MENLRYWLLKTEPSTYSFDQLVKDRKTNWNDIRNYQARNHIKGMKAGDLALIYHSGDEKAVIGVARVLSAAYPDLDPDGGEWAQVDIEAVEKFKRRVDLKIIKTHQELSDMPLIKQSRLSVMPLTYKHYEVLIHLGK